MTDATAESSPPAPSRPRARWRSWRLPKVPVYIWVPIYLMVIGVLFRYALYYRNTGHASFNDYIRALCVYDCNAYERLALYGYEGRPSGFDKGDANNWAFFPLYSILMWAIAKVTTVSALLAGSILSNVLTAGAAMLSWPLFEGKFRAWLLFVFYLFLGPFAYYFTTPYTESLFLLLAVATFVVLKDRDYITAGFLGALMSATRSTGLLIAPAILISAYLDHRKDGGTFADFVTGIWRRTDLMLAVAMVPLGICMFAVYMYVHSGDALAFVHIQRAWGRLVANPFTNLWEALSIQFTNHSTQWFTTDLAFGVAAIGGMILSVVLAIKGRWAEAMFALLGILLPLSTNTYSMVRFVVALPPIMIVASLLLARYRPVFYATLAAFLICDVLLLPTWISRSYYLM